MDEGDGDGDGGGGGGGGDGRAATVLKAVFPLLEGKDLAACECVCRQWREISRDDFLWKRLCERRWPSICGGVGGRGYRRIFSTFSNTKGERRRRRSMKPRIGFRDLEFYVDVWLGSRAVYSAIVPGSVVQTRISSPPPGICESMRAHLAGSDYKMTLPVSPRFQVSFGSGSGIEMETPPRMSMLVKRLDRDQVATIIDGSTFDYVDGPECRAHAYDFLQLSPLHPFLDNIRAWVALLLVDRSHGCWEVFGIELDFLETANSDCEVLCLLEMLDWKSIDD